MRDLPLYLFTGFLESGKTKFIQETLEDPRFNAGEKTLLLLCEEGEEEYDISKMPAHNVFIRTINDKADLTVKNIDNMVKETGAERIVVEYNGMWMLQELFSALPRYVIISQELCFFDANMAQNYNANMRQLVYDKLSTAEMIIFNRTPENLDIMPLHKLVRGANRRADIAYEYTDGSVKYDDIEDRLPFDINAEVINIQDIDYALWFQDMMNDMPKYMGKTIKFKGIVARDSKIPDDTFVVGRQVMTCCADDIKYCGIACDWKGAKSLKTNDWVIVTAKLSIGNHKLYRSKGPYLTAIEVAVSSKPEQEVAAFY
jgi:hypothetical protein